MRLKLYLLVPIVIFLLIACNVLSSNKVYFVDVNNPHRDYTTGSFKIIHEALQKHGYELICVRNTKKIEDFHCIIYNKVCSGDVIRAARLPKEKQAIFLWEPPVVRPQEYEKSFHEPFGTIFTLCDDLIDNKTYFKFFNPVHVRPIETSSIPFHEKKLAVMINANKDSSHHLSLYAERRKVIEFFETNHSDDFDLYGHGWSTRRYKNYRGSIPNKIPCLQQYKFCFAYENTRGLNGYITEKIFDAMFAGVVPIYYGADNVTDYIPKNCFIDRRDFSNEEELYQYIVNMSEEEHAHYINAIDYFLQSDEAMVFSWHEWAQIFLSFVDYCSASPQLISQISSPEK